MERTPNKSQHTKLTVEKKILPPLLPGFELAFRSRVLRFYQQANPAPGFGGYGEQNASNFLELPHTLWSFLFVNGLVSSNNGLVLFDRCTPVVTEEQRR